MSFTIKQKMAIMISISLILTICAVFFSIFKYRSLLEKNKNLLTATNESLLTLKSMQIEIEKFKNKKTIEPIKIIKKLVDDFDRQTFERKRIANKSNNISLIKILNESELKISAIKEKLDQVYNRKISNINKWTSYLSLEVNALADQVSKFAKDQKEILKIKTSNTQTLIIIIVAIIVLAIIILSGWISTSIINPTTRLINTISSIQREGDLTKKIYVKSGDEIGILSKTFNELIANLNLIVKNIRKTSEEILGLSKDFVNSASSLDRCSHNIADSVADISKGANIQSRQVEKSSLTIEKLLHSVSQVANRAQSAADKTKLANQIGEKGEKATKSTIAKMRDIQVVVNNSSEVVKRLGEKTKQIGLIVSAITKISEETNLLALNTAIEAARAGETASGFAVVAEDVRKLAESSAKSAEEIKKIVKEIQSETASAISSIEMGTKEVFEGTEIVNKTGSAIEELLKTVWEVTTIAEEISKLTKEQSDDCEKVRKATSAITTIASENLKISQEALSSTEEQTKLTKSITDSVNKLDEISKELYNTVKTFNI